MPLGLKELDPCGPEEQALFEAWQTTAVELAVSSLKYNVLIKDPRTGAYKVNFAKESRFGPVRVKRDASKGPACRSRLKLWPFSTLHLLACAVLVEDRVADRLQMVRHRCSLRTQADTAGIYSKKSHS